MFFFFNVSSIFQICFIFSVTELTEGTDYKIVFTAGNNELTLNVYLSGDFPNECPQIRITPLIVHPWVSVDGQVTKAPGLLNVCEL